MWKIKDQEIREKIRLCVYLDCSNKSSWAGQPLWKLRELTLQKLWTVISVCTSEHSGLVAGGQGSRRAKILFIWQQRHNSQCWKEAGKRSLFCLIWPWIFGLRWSFCLCFSSSWSYRCIPLTRSGSIFLLSVVQLVVLRLVSYVWVTVGLEAEGDTR